jgi:oxygen-independent coproporphyrinogen III oxidase
MNIDFDMIRKYDRPGPRYTSYPSALHFSPRHLNGLRGKIAESNAKPRDLSLYVHLPFCRSLCWYCGCNTVITKKQCASSEYLTYLEREIELVSRMTNPDRRVVQLHFGGGTPTFLLPEELKRLVGMLRTKFEFAPSPEAGVEIDVRTLTPEHITALREAGFNRASFGVQDDTPEVQEAIHRIQPYEQTAEAVQRVRDAGFSAISFDLIYGLPRQTPESFALTLDNILKLQPNRLSVFSYAHVPSIKPAQKLLERIGLPGTEAKLELLRITVEKMQAAGYEYIGLDHFARHDDELAVALRSGTLRRNFQGYSTQAPADVYGLGVSSISQIQGAYWQNHKILPEFYASLDRDELPWNTGYVLGEDDRIRAAVIMSLMCNLRVDFAEQSEQGGYDYREYFAPELQALRPFEDDGLVSFDSDVLEVSAAGRFVIRSIAMQFDSYMMARPGACYSRAV